jgi:hypothetical protein
VQTPSPDHQDFDRMCAEVDDFEPLPAVKPASLERRQDNEDDTTLDGQIMAGLVSPV